MGADVVPISRRTGFDLRNPVDAFTAISREGADVVVHLAARVGGIIANMNAPGSFFYDNMQMGMNVVHAAAMAGSRLLLVGTICSYPKDCPVPFKEEDLWNGFPEPTNAPYGIAKKALLVMCQAYRKEHGLHFGYVCPVNLYGPNDNFDDSTSHVIPALIKRFVKAKEQDQKRVTCFGTGKATRSFLYIEDAAKAIALAVKDLDEDELINLPGCPETSISDLTRIIARYVGYEGSITWDTSKPDGQPRRFVDGTRAEMLLGWEPATSLESGLRRTIEWYRSRSEE